MTSSYDNLIFFKQSICPDDEMAYNTSTKSFLDLSEIFQVLHKLGVTPIYRQPEEI